MNRVSPDQSSKPASRSVRGWIGFIRSSEAVRYFVGKGVLLWPLNILGVGLGIISTILYARLLSPAEYGQFSYVIATMAVLSFLSLQGIYTAVAQGAAQGQDGLMVEGTRVRLKFSLLGSVAMVIVGFACWHSKGTDVAISFFFGAAVFPAFNAYDNCWAILMGKKAFDTFAKYRAVQMLATTGATWVTLILTQRVPLVFAANVGVNALTTAVFYHLAVRRYKTNDLSSPDSIKYGKRLSALGVITSVESRLDQVVLGTFLPFAEVGWFNMAARMNEAAVWGLWTVISRLLFPQLAECSEPEARRRTRVWGGYLIIAFTALAALFWVFASWLLPVILGPKYVESVGLSKWLVLITALGLGWPIFEVYCQARAAEKALWAARLVLTGTHLALLALLIKPMGLTGVLISIAGARVAVMATAAWAFRSHTRQAAR